MPLGFKLCTSSPSQSNGLTCGFCSKRKGNPVGFIMLADIFRGIALQIINTPVAGTIMKQ